MKNSCFSWTGISTDKQGCFVRSFCDVRVCTTVGLGRKWTSSLSSISNGRILLDLWSKCYSESLTSQSSVCAPWSPLECSDWPSTYFISAQKWFTIPGNGFLSRGRKGHSCIYFGLVVTVGSEQSLLRGLLLDPEVPCFQCFPLWDALLGRYSSLVLFFHLPSHAGESCFSYAQVSIVLILVEYHGNISWSTWLKMTSSVQ